MIRPTLRGWTPARGSSSSSSPWLAHQRAPDLDEPTLAAAETPSEIVGLRRQAESGQDLHRPFSCSALRAAPPAPTQDGTSQRLAPDQPRPAEEVLDHREPLELRRQLEGAPDARPSPPVRGPRADLVSVEEDLARVVTDRSGDEIQERGLAGTVRTDDAGDLALAEAGRRSVDGEHAPEGPGHLANIQKRAGRRRRSTPARRLARFASVPGSIARATLPRSLPTWPADSRIPRVTVAR